MHHKQNPAFPIKAFEDDGNILGGGGGECRFNYTGCQRDDVSRSGESSERDRSNWYN